MSTTQTNTIAKIAAVVAGLGIVAMSFASFAVPAKADTASVSAQIAALQAQLAALMASQGGSSSASVTFSTDLTMGSKGADVTALQNWLIGKGFSIAAGATGYFGAQTKAAVAAWQTSAGISPAAGYFGPKSRAAANAAGGTTGTTGTTNTTGLTGSGYLTSISTLGDIVSDVKEGDTGDQVIGESVRAVNGDVALDRLDVSFDLTSAAAAGGSTALNRYVQSVSVWQDGKKLATMNPSDGSYQNKVWTLRFTGLNGVIKSGNTSLVHVAVDAVSSVNSAEAGKTVTASIPANGLRAVNAAGVGDTYDATVRTQNFTVSAANTGKLTLTEASDDPAATTVKADLNNTTTNVTLLAFNAKATNQNVTLRAIPVGITGTGGNVTDMIQSVSLMQGGTAISTKTVTNASGFQEVVFDNLNQSISKDATTEYTVVATIKKIDSGNTFSSGDTLTATTTATGTTNFDVSDSQGRTVTPAGAVQGHVQTFQALGITVTQVTATANKSVGTTVGSGDSTQYAVTFKMTAGDTDLYIPTTIVRGTAAAANQIVWATTTSSTQGTASASTTLGTANVTASDSNSADTATVFKIPAGSSRTFTANVTVNEVAGTLFTGVRLIGIGYGTTTNPTNNYVSYTSGLDQFKTTDVSMTTH